MSRRLTMAEWAVAVFGTNPIQAAFLAGDAGAPADEQVVTFEVGLPTNEIWGQPA